MWLKCCMLKCCGCFFAHKQLICFFTFRWPCIVINKFDVQVTVHRDKFDVQVTVHRDKFDVQVTVHRDKFLQQNQLDSLISQIYFWDKTLHVSDSSSVHHQEFFTVHTAMVYVIQVCWQLASRIRTELQWIKTMKNSWWWTEELSETCRVLFQK